MSVGNNAWGPLRFDLLSTDKYTNVTPNVMQELGELSKKRFISGLIFLKSQLNMPLTLPLALSCGVVATGRA